jgi:hypothetical protein
MDAFVQIALVPLITGILTALVYILFVRFGQGWSEYVSPRHWGKHLSVFQVFTIIGGIASLGVTLYGVNSGVHKNYCDKREQYAIEIVDLVPKISYALNYEIGAGNVCYTYDGKPSGALSDDMFKSAENLRTNTYLLSFKIKFFPENTIMTAISSYNDATKDLREYCKDVQFDELQRKKSVVNDSGRKLIEILGMLNANCYQ